MAQQEVMYDKLTFRVLKRGFTDLRRDSLYDRDLHTILRLATPFEFALGPSGDDQVWYFDQGSSFTVNLPVPLPAALLGELKAVKAAQIGAAVTAYVYRHYDAEAQSSLEAMYARAEATGKANRAAHIGPAIDWVEAVLGEFYARIENTMGATNADGVHIQSVDFSEFDSQDPEVSIKDALAITD